MSADSLSEWLKMTPPLPATTSPNNDEHVMHAVPFEDSGNCNLLDLHQRQHQQNQNQKQAILEMNQTIGGGFTGMIHDPEMFDQWRDLSRSLSTSSSTSTSSTTTDGHARSASSQHTNTPSKEFMLCADIADVSTSPFGLWVDMTMDTGKDDSERDGAWPQPKSTASISTTAATTTTLSQHGRFDGLGTSSHLCWHEHEQEQSRSSQLPTTFDDLPREIRVRILSYLHATDVWRAAAVSRAWNDVANDRILWRYILEKEMPLWPTVTSDTIPGHHAMFKMPKETYRACSPMMGLHSRALASIRPSISSLTGIFARKKRRLRIAVFGAGLEHIAHSLVEDMLWGSDTPFTVGGMLPGTHGVGGGVSLELGPHLTLDMITLYQKTASERRQHNDHDNGHLREGEGILPESAQRICSLVDAFVFVVDAGRLADNDPTIEAMSRQSSNHGVVTPTTPSPQPQPQPQQQPQQRQHQATDAMTRSDVEASSQYLSNYNWLTDSVNRDDAMYHSALTTHGNVIGAMTHRSRQNTPLNEAKATHHTARTTLDLLGDDVNDEEVEGAEEGSDRDGLQTVGSQPRPSYVDHLANIHQQRCVDELQTFMDSRWTSSTAPLLVWNCSSSATTRKSPAIATTDLLMLAGQKRAWRVDDVCVENFAGPVAKSIHWLEGRLNRW